MIEDELMVCQWPKCRAQASHEIHYDEEMIRTCSPHRGAVMVNIRTYGKIWTFERNQAHRSSAIVRPGQDAPRYHGTKPTVKGAADGAAKDWQQEAAQQADVQAQPIGPVTKLVRPQARRQGSRGPTIIPVSPDSKD